MSRRSTKRPISQINVVPFIDIALVLLITFMVTAPMMTNGQINLPQAGKSMAQQIAPLEVMIDKDGGLSLQDRSKSTAPQKVSRDELVAAIQGRQQANPDQAVVIAADKSVRYETVMDVMSLLQDNQIQKIGLLAQQKNQ